MPKILYNFEWYEQVSTNSLYEDEFEQIIESHALSIFPRFHLVKFKKIVSSDSGSAKPDYALIHCNYREWYVVEVELGHHSLVSHVKPQVEILCNAVYGNEEALYLHSQDQCLDVNRLSAMIKGSQPQVLIIVNSSVDDWLNELSQYNVLISIFEVFRSRHNRYIYRLNGQQPIELGIQRSICTVPFSRMLRLDSPGILKILNREKLFVKYFDGIVEFVRIDIHDSVFLSAAKPLPLDQKKVYELIENDDGSYLLREFIRSLL